MGRFAACSSCGARIEWVVTDRGARTPVDAEPVERGNLLLRKVQGEELARMVCLSKAELRAHHAQAQREGRPVRLFRSHFQSCPNAPQHRRRVEAERAGEAQVGLF